MVDHRTMQAHLSDAPGSLRARNVLFLLGAGASYDHGYPLVGEFLSPKYLTWLCDQCAGIPAGLGDPAFARAEAEQFRKISENFEEVLSTAFETPALYKRVLDYTYWLLGTVWQIVHSRNLNTTAEYLGLAVLMFEISKAGRCSVISFNYDTAVEDALSSLSRMLAPRGTPKELLYFNYGYEQPVFNVLPERTITELTGSELPRSYPNGRLPVLKLHGSVTTLTCGKCGTMHYFPMDTLLDATPYAIKPCQSCGDTSLQPLLVPPGKRKKIPIALDQLWSRAQDELASTALVVIAGYSMPEYDGEARSMLQTALRNKDVLLVDPAPNASAIEFLSNTAKVNLRVIRQTTAAFLRQELSVFVPGLVDKVAEACATIYLYGERMAGHPRA
jgi:NAD-dependent SIR2 family protein deacetylase